MEKKRPSPLMRVEIRVYELESINNERLLAGAFRHQPERFRACLRGRGLERLNNGRKNSYTHTPEENRLVRYGAM
jgi:hypothetical protein